MKRAVLLIADWSKNQKKRAVYKAYSAPLKILYQPPDGGAWTLAGLLDLARRERESHDSAVLIALDVGLGVPAQIVEHSSLSVEATFPEWLLSVNSQPGFFDEVEDADLWSPDRPFIRVPRGRGGYTRFRDNRFGIPLLRPIDKYTGGKPVFVVSGIPGTVGSASREIWKDLVKLLPANGRDFALWPFEGDLGELVADGCIVVGETYPRAAYATALRDEPFAQLLLPKTREVTRRAALEQLERTHWWREARVALLPQDRERAARDDDAFDAMITAAALLRCTTADLRLYSPDFYNRIEGAIWGTGTIDLQARPERFR